METFIKGDVVIVPFPFSDLTKTKRRPAFVVTNLTGDDLILCQITSQNTTDSYAITITNEDFITGGLNQNSNIRPNKLFTAANQLILYKAGELKPEKTQAVIAKIINILRQ